MLHGKQRVPSSRDLLSSSYSADESSTKPRCTKSLAYATHILAAVASESTPKDETRFLGS